MITKPIKRNSTFNKDFLIKCEWSWLLSLYYEKEIDIIIILTNINYAFIYMESSHSFPWTHVFIWWISAHTTHTTHTAHSTHLVVDVAHIALQHRVSHTPINLSVFLSKSWLSSLLDNMFHSNSRYKPIWLSLIIMSHMIFTKESELLFVIQL